MSLPLYSPTEMGGAARIRYPISAFSVLLMELLFEEERFLFDTSSLSPREEVKGYVCVCVSEQLNSDTIRQEMNK